MSRRRIVIEDDDEDEVEEEEELEFDWQNPDTFARAQEIQPLNVGTVPRATNTFGTHFQVRIQPRASNRTYDIVRRTSDPLGPTGEIGRTGNPQLNIRDYAMNARLHEHLARRLQADDIVDLDRRFPRDSHPNNQLRLPLDDRGQNAVTLHRPRARTHDGRGGWTIDSYIPPTPRRRAYFMDDKLIRERRRAGSPSIYGEARGSVQQLGVMGALPSSKALYSFGSFEQVQVGGSGRKSHVYNMRVRALNSIEARIRLADMTRRRHMRQDQWKTMTDFINSLTDDTEIERMNNLLGPGGRGPPPPGGGGRGVIV